MIEELPVGQRAAGKPKAPGQLDTKWRFLHNLLLQKCKPMKSDRETAARIRATI